MFANNNDCLPLLLYLCCCRGGAHCFDSCHWMGRCGCLPGCGGINPCFSRCRSCGCSIGCGCGDRGGSSWWSRCGC